MPWTCRLLTITGTEFVEYDPPRGNLLGETVFLDDKRNHIKLSDLKPGNMFLLPENRNKDEWPWYFTTDDDLSDYYHRENKKHREPLFVMLPGRVLFLVDGKCHSDGKKYGGWTVTGNPPNITVTPSINIGGIYHGFLKDGILSDDVEQRVFSDNLIKV